MVQFYNAKKILCAFFLLFFLYHYAQTGLANTAQIDSLQKSVFDRMMNRGDYKGIVLQERKLILDCQKLNYIKGETVGYLNLAHALCALTSNKESLYFLNIADKKLKYLHDDALKARMNHLYGRNYYFLGLYEQSIKSFNKSLEFAHKIKDKEERKKKIFAVYDWKRSSFGYLNMMDSVYSNERKCMQFPTPMLYIDIAERHLKSKNIDSAEYYVNEANNLALSTKNLFEGKSNVLRAYGELYIAKGENERALKFLFESLAITKEMGNKRRNLEAYKLIAEAYKNINDIEKENEYLEKYAKLEDSITLADKGILNMSIEKFLNEYTENEQKNKNKLYYIIIAVILASTAVILILFNVYEKKQKQKEARLNQTDLETHKLRKKLDSAYEEVAQLAISRDPLFMTKFKEVYAEFYHNLISEYPNLTANDIKFCAMVKLNFSNKEIAQYDNMSIRTVESKKYRLRKKLNLAADTDFNGWITSL